LGLGVTWLPIGGDGQSERTAVLALEPEASARWLVALEATWSASDPAVLDTCRMRMAQLFGCRAVLAETSDERLAVLERWGSSPAVTEHERAALAVTEQFVIDQNGITDDQRASLAEHLSERQVIAFVQALNLHDGFLRTLALFDVEPEAVPVSQTRSGDLTAVAADPRETDDLPADGRARFQALAHPALVATRGAFGAYTALLGSIDRVTTEICRLRNASHQTCLF
jgi:alkylhydroperoxidase family enzyme